MISLIKRYLVPHKKAKRTINDLKIFYKRKFFESEFHKWIIQDRLYTRAFEMFIDYYDDDIYRFFSRNKDIVFIKASGKFSCALSSLENHHVVIIFPDLCKLLKSASPTHGLAILAHEIGHIIYEHSSQGLPPLEAQIEADSFASRMGLGAELKSMLLEYPDDPDCRARIKYLCQTGSVDN